MAPSSQSSSPYFLGPRSENGDWAHDRFETILTGWLAWRARLFPNDPAAITDARRREPDFLARQAGIDRQVAELRERLGQEVPTHTPRYIGHMVSEVALPAMLGHLTALLHNPNNTSREASNVNSTQSQRRP